MLVSFKCPKNAAVYPTRGYWCPVNTVDPPLLTQHGELLTSGSGYNAFVCYAAP